MTVKSDVDDSPTFTILTHMSFFGKRQIYESIGKLLLIFYEDEINTKVKLRVLVM